MYSLAEIYRSKDSSVEYWQTEYSYITTNYPKLTQSIEKLIVACAASPHRETFESDYFGYSLEEYADGGSYTDSAVELMINEAELEAQFSALSTSTVEISYKRTGTDIVWEGTVDEVTAMAREYFAGDDKKFNDMLVLINDLYEAQLSKIQNSIYVDLIKVRRLIADELGYSSYRDLAYADQKYEYAPEDMISLLEDIGRYVNPVAFSLENVVFNGYFSSNPQPVLNNVELVNKLYGVYSGLGGDYKDAYSYMLQHRLYDVSKASENRYGGAFTVYVENNNSPYLFMTSSGFIRDYGTLAHEFGHFLDGYVNDGMDTSLTACEVSSQALELLTVLKLKGHLKSAQYEYLEYYTLRSFLNTTLLTQSFYAMFEHLVYELEYDEISVASINSVIEEAFSLIYGDELSIVGNLSYVAIPHTILYPFYVESYVTSGLMALDIFFAESARTGKSGDGFAIYESFINIGDESTSLIEMLEKSGLDSPFADGRVRDIANDFYYQVMGKNYYTYSDYEIDAA